MSLENYKRTIEEYIAKKDSTQVSKDTAKGLLAPKSNGKAMPEVSKKQEDTIANVAEFVYMLRQKRREIVKARTTKKGTKKNGK